MSEPVAPEGDTEPSAAMHLIAPIAAIGATMVMRKVLSVGYARSTGGPAPDPRDPRVSFGRALAWAIITAATAAAVETVVYRVMNRGTHESD
ncbi:MAG: DUF4235 domain-containing protein [Candidatus Nanopelagicales bacterium]|nr:DUF4235 domain-containing protein [Candidatus Nanopelagicales bacterium]